LLYDVESQGRVRRVAVTRHGGRYTVAVDGRSWEVDVARVDAHLLSLVMTQTPRPEPARDGNESGESYEVTVSPGSAPGRLIVHVGPIAVPVTLNGRPRRRQEPGQATGRQELVAPMPGKVVRLLVEPGTIVRARQPIVVIEAMKMENELRSSGEGTVAGVHVKEGASVEAGALLVVIE
jgi:biotin carboxyl carrier protein